MSENLARILMDTAAEHGDRVAFKLDDVELTYGMLDEGSARIAGLLRSKGLEPGDRVGVMLPNVPYFPVVYYGVLRAGCVVVPMNVLLKEREVSFYLEDPGAKLVFAWRDFAEAAQAGAEEAGAECVLVKPGEFEELLAAAEPDPELVDRAGDDTAVILYTSGTTGKPKGAELTHGNLRRNCGTAATTLAELSPDDVLLGALPLFHSFGQTCTMNSSVANGSTRHDAPAVRSGEGAGDHRARPGDRLPRGADDVQRMLHAEAADAADTSTLRALHVRRRGHAGRADARLRGEVRLHDPRGLRAVRDVAGRLLQPPRPRAQAGLDRHARSTAWR